jgi:hypothetical protein
MRDRLILLAISILVWIIIGWAAIPAIYIVYLVYKKRMIQAFIVGALYVAFLGLPEIMASL